MNTTTAPTMAKKMAIERCKVCLPPRTSAGGTGAKAMAKEKVVNTASMPPVWLAGSPGLAHEKGDAWMLGRTE